jgi:hypothetical protein
MADERGVPKKGYAVGRGPAPSSPFEAPDLIGRAREYVGMQLDPDVKSSHPLSAYARQLVGELADEVERLCPLVEQSNPQQGSRFTLSCGEWSAECAGCGTHVTAGATHTCEHWNATKEGGEGNENG